MKNILKNKNFLVIFLAIIVFIIIFLIKNYFILIDKYLIYEYLNSKNKSLKFSFNNNIVVVKIDEKSLKEIGSFPFSRKVYLDVFKNLKEKGASIVGLDVILSDNGPDKHIDDNLALTIKKSNNIILGAPIYNGNYIDLPIEKFRKNALAVGFFNPKIDKNTNSVYSFYPQLQLRNTHKQQYELFNNFDIEIIKKYFGETKIFTTKQGLNIGDNIVIPYSYKNSKEILINFLNKNKLKYNISISDIYFKNHNFKQFDFKNKIVLIGATAQGLKDTFNTPNGIDFGIYVHANILNTILSGKSLVYFNKYLELLLIFLLIIVAIYFNFAKNNKLLLLSNFAIFFIFIFLPYILLIPTNLILNNPTSIILAFIFSITFSNIAKFLIENKNKQKLVKALGEYISKDIAKEILNSSGNIKLDGDNKKISIFFSDIAGFTTISEQMNAEELVEFLREYLGLMSNIIMDEKGFINKYEGDAIMALFGVFGYENTSSYDNCLAALKQQQNLKILNQIWQKKFGQVLKVRMGLHSGKAIIGNIGSKGRKMEFTALGDSVNLASRLEGVNKFYGTSICVSEDVVKDVSNDFEFRKLDKIRVKGKEIPIIIYELLGEKNKISDLQRQIKDEFEKALELYFQKDFSKAKENFHKLGQLGDLTSIIFEKRCFKFEISGVKDDWDGVWTLTEK